MRVPWRDERVRQMYRHPEVKASLEIILSVFTVVFLLGVALRPTLSTIAELQKKISDQETVDKKLGQKINQLTKAQADLTTYAAQLPLYTAAVTDEHDQPGLVKRMSLLAQESGLTVNFMTWGAVPLVGAEIELGDKEAKKKGGNKPKLEEGTKIAYFEISFDFRGTQTQVFNFLANLEKTDRMVRLKNLDLKREEEKDSVTNQVFRGLRVTGKAIAYYLPPGP